MTQPVDTDTLLELQEQRALVRHLQGKIEKMNRHATSLATEMVDHEQHHRREVEALGRVIAMLREQVASRLSKEAFRLAVEFVSRFEPIVLVVERQLQADEGLTISRHDRAHNIADALGRALQSEYDAADYADDKPDREDMC